ncbi:MAG: hypothetical protein WBW61_08240, partial [Rhodanobacteraceae bacterium]
LPDAAPSERATRTTGRSVNIVPWAVAALLLVGAASATYAWRAHIPALNGLFGHTQVSVTNAANSPPMRITDASDTPGPDASTGAEPSTSVDATDGRSSQPVGTDTSVPDADRSEPMSANGEEAATVSSVPAAASTQRPQRVAEVTRPKSAAPAKPHIPTVAILSGGDDAITGPAENAVGRMLRNRGFRVIEGGHVAGDRPNLRALKGRADAVVFVHARPIGSQELAYYGQSSTLYTVQMNVKTYAVSDAHLLGDSATEQVNFTSLNAADKARETITPMLEDVARDLEPYRPRSGKG